MCQLFITYITYVRFLFTVACYMVSKTIHFPDSLQVWRFFPVWIRVCIFRPLGFCKLLLTYVTWIIFVFSIINKHDISSSLPQQTANVCWKTFCHIIHTKAFRRHYSFLFPSLFQCSGTTISWREYFQWRSYCKTLSFYQLQSRKWSLLSNSSIHNICQINQLKK